VDGSGVVETVLEDVLGADLDSAPLEVLEREMMSMAGHLAAGTARWLAWLATAGGAMRAGAVSLRPSGSACAAAYRCPQRARKSA